MPKGIDITKQEYDKDGVDAKSSRLNKPHARETKAHISAENSTAPHKPGKTNFGNLGFKPNNG
jgi:hypothetical protein